MKYFSSTLLNVLKDVPGQPMVKIRCRDSDTERLGLFPSLDYKGLYSTLLQFLDIVDLLPNGLYDFGKALLVTLCSLVPFLERELIGKRQNCLEKVKFRFWYLKVFFYYL